MLSFQLSKSVFNKKCSAEISAAQLPIYPVIQAADYKKAYEGDDLVTMRRHFFVSCDWLKEDWARYAQEIKTFWHVKNHMMSSYRCQKRAIL